MKRYIAFVKGPNGHVWNDTARTGEGNEAEYLAKRQAQDAACRTLTANMIKTIPYGLWESMRESGFECICLNISEENNETSK